MEKLCLLTTADASVEAVLHGTKPVKDLEMLRMPTVL